MPLSDRKYQVINKELGETPLEALERFRAEHKELAGVPMTYAGRLDPLAEGELIILIGEECKNKEKYLGLDKEYEVEILLGISTDTHDALGLVDMIFKENRNHSDSRWPTALNLSDYGSPFTNLDFNKYIGKFSQPYPAYSSKTVGGVQLHELSRKNELPDELPVKEVEIYEIEILGQEKISATDLKQRVINNVSLVKGDFRQKEIVAKWNEVFEGLNNDKQTFPVIKIRVKCSSGTYMRSLADRIGKDVGCGAFALGIKRTEIFKKPNL